MKKTLLALAIASTSAFAANAGKVALVVENEPYFGNADEIITVYIGAENPTWVSNAFTLKLETAPGASSTAASAQANGSFHWYKQTLGTLTPAPGVTITKIEVETPISYDKPGGTETYTYAIPYNDGFSVYDASMEWTGSISGDQTLALQPKAQSRFTIFEVTYTGTPTLPSIPVIYPEPTVVAAYDAIELESETEGAKIYYTTDGTEPTESSKLYTAPFSFGATGTSTVKTMAVKDGKSSPVATYTYAVVEGGLETVVYDFRSTDYLTIDNKEFPTKPSSSACWISLNGAELENDDVTIYVGKEADGTNPRMRQSMNGLVVEFYMVSGNTLDITVPDDMYIGGILFAGSSMKTITYDTTIGTVKTGGYSSSYNMWRPKDGKRVNSVEFGATGNNYIDNIYVSYASLANTGIDDIATDNSNAPAEYYNLQGVRLNGDNLPAGIYIRRQGSNVEKVLKQ